MNSKNAIANATIAGSFAAALIPETLERTGLGESRVGSRVNLEFDVMAKFARQLLAPYLPGIAR